MLRRYFSLVIPVAFSAVAGLVYLHFQQAPRAQAGAPEIVQLAQAAQPEVQPEPKPADPAPADPDKPVDPDPPKKLKKHHHHKPRAKRPENRDELQTPYLRHLYDQLEGIEGGTDEERDSVRGVLYDADVELRDSLGEGALRRIREANRPRPAFRVDHPRKLLCVPLTDPLPLTPAARKPQPDAKLVDPDAKPADPPPPKTDGFDDLFKKD